MCGCGVRPHPPQRVDMIETQADVKPSQMDFEWRSRETKPALSDHVVPLLVLTDRRRASLWELVCVCVLSCCCPPVHVHVLAGVAMAHWPRHLEGARAACRCLLGVRPRATAVPARACCVCTGAATLGGHRARGAGVV